MLPFWRDVETCDRCHLASRKCIGYGNADARVMLLAQNPGSVPPHDRDGSWTPFYMDRWPKNGEPPSGRVLRDVLREAEIPETDLYITNAMKCLGTPTDTYVGNCSDWLEQELHALPQLILIVAMGKIAARRLGVSQAGQLSFYRTKRDEGEFLPLKRLIVTTTVFHPGAPLHPGGIDRESYIAQWRFVGATYRRLIREGRVELWDDAPRAQPLGRRSK